MNKRPVVFYVLLYFIIFIAAVGVMAVVIYGKINTLSRETDKIAAMDISEESVDLSIKLGGKYGIVEKTIKEYVNEYVTDLQRLSDIPADERLTEMLGTSNITQDAPDFTGSRAYLDELRSQTALLAERLIAKGDSASIDRAFSETGLNFFMKRVYNNQMYNHLSLDFFYSEREIEKASEQILQILDDKEAVLDFLTGSKDRWHFDGNVIEFESEELLNEYLEILEDR